LVWAGTVSVLEYTWIALAWKLPDLRKRRRLIVGHFFNCLIAVVLSSIWDIRPLFLASVGFLVFVQVSAWKNLRAFYVLSAFSLLPFAIVLDSKLLLAVGGMMIGGWMSHLAHKVFKNSLMFPFALVAIGGMVIYSGILYQTHHEALRGYAANSVAPSRSTISTMLTYSHVFLIFPRFIILQWIVPDASAG
jgi:hypothetical protein